MSGGRPYHGAMFQPNKRQWRVIWVVATAVLLLWPLGDSPSLAVKAIHFAADPRGALPVLPEPLPMGVGDDGEAVMQHDMQTAQYYDAWDSSAWTRTRIRVRDWRPGVSPATERQILIAFVVLSALLVWRLGSLPVPTEGVTQK
jgi:hypothetical protein